MPTYTAPARDARFIINELLDLASYGNLPGFEMVSEDVVEAVINEGGKFCAEVLAPLNRVGDEHGCVRNEDGSVTTPPGFKEAFDQFREAGWGTISAPEEFGGQGMPHVLGFVMEEFISSANQAFGMYPGLTNGAISALIAKGSDEQKTMYLPKMISNEWTGTMNLTEPHCGTDLGMIRTKAEPQGDGSYSITGTKIFISAGEHDMSENIIHLVLAKTPGAPDSTKGISLFVVPKFLVNEDGSLGERNGVMCGSIEEKMGIHGNSTCVLNYDGAKGWLVGEENKGLAAMFIMMNAARLGVGIQGLSQAEVAYQNAVAYALDRRQGRALTGPAEPDQQADPIFVHPDVRRMLMDAKAFTEGMRALALWGGLLVDLIHKAETEEEREEADLLLGLMTPVIKGYGTDKGYEVATNMQQVFGGHGYIEEWGMSQFVRDARIAQIYEGTNGVQAMDLCGRKLAQKGGAGVQAFFKHVGEEIAAAKEVDELKDMAEQLEKALGQQQAATMWFMQNAMQNPNHLGAGAHHYMHIMGIVTLGLMWLKMAKVAQAKLGSAGDDKAFYEQKLATARYYMDRYLPDAGALRRKLEAGSDSLMALGEDAFQTAA
ncbi:acyl-CoA dehydrogenase C-terminal domain-containing protein [Qipengyuania huizhouensis]|uniref:acyl-CoA dehydrogenase C-terminal domain-containing protein n=1 Tax=Qipengyuania huizhouensis TaxID=2867245 RepID=UPI001C86D8A5|nr:acyl-CoA dehydrogenase C-terminal domain-containing protein [Qipengyuania huizhouensis]MBX7460471.1 acyl-CoA dehydrogenase C-terminal domain-containing protein [Qipengyuania huizhouensis]